MAQRVRLETPSMRRRDEFIEASRRSRRTHHPYVKAPTTPGGFAGFLERRLSPDSPGHLVIDTASDRLVGIVNISDILRGALQSAFLGYYVFHPHEGRGLMRAGLALVLAKAFRQLRLHRLEANIQPENLRSIALVQSLGFELEGLSPRYLKVGGRWRDHERWALRSEEWRHLR
jgi:ribosomal-protein-alanine N-acetyltransferase